MSLLRFFCLLLLLTLCIVPFISAHLTEDHQTAVVNHENDINIPTDQTLLEIEQQLNADIAAEAESESQSETSVDVDAESQLEQVR